MPQITRRGREMIAVMVASRAAAAMTGCIVSVKLKYETYQEAPTTISSPTPELPYVSAILADLHSNTWIPLRPKEF